MIFRPAITIKQLLLGIQDLLINPNPSSPAQGVANDMLLNKPKDYKLRIRQQAEKAAPTDDFE